MAESQVFAFRAIFVFHEAQGALQELLPRWTAHDVIHVPARKDVTESEVRKAAHKAFTHTHIPRRAYAQGGVRAVLSPDAAQVIPSGSKVINQVVEGADCNPF
jgi:hypothetical protein